MLTKTLIITSVETYVSKNYNVNKESWWRRMTKHFSFSIDLIVLSLFFFSVFFFCLIFFKFTCCFEKNLPTASSEKKSHRHNQAIFFSLTSLLQLLKNTKLFGSAFNIWAKDFLSIKVFNTPEFCWYWLSNKLHWTKTISRLITFSHSLFCQFIFLCYQNNFMVSGVHNSSLYLSFILNTNLLLFLLM